MSAELQQRQQQRIVDWFDATYRRKGDRYLRPTRAYYVYLELLRARTGESLLDVGCGLGRLLEAARAYDLQSSGIDVSGVAIDAARINVPDAELELGNAEALPYADAAFDLVTCIGSLERMLDAETALAEMRRVGKPAARYCLLVRNAHALGWKLQSWLPGRSNPGHAGAKSRAEWTALLERAGFRITRVLPDQYPLQRRRQWASLFLRPVDFRTVLAGPLESANEFVFLLEKRA